MSMFPQGNMLRRLLGRLIVSPIQSVLHHGYDRNVVV